MKDAAFQELLTSVRQAGQIRRGTRRPSRTTAFRPSDVQAVRAKLGVSQAEFALMIGVSVATLRNWEQGRRTPDGPALALLRVAARNPNEGRPDSAVRCSGSPIRCQLGRGSGASRNRDSVLVALGDGDHGGLD